MYGTKQRIKELRLGIIMEAKIRYHEAHKIHFAKEYPNAFRSGHYTAPAWLKVATANGLTNYIINFVNWSGYRATRISTTGRKIGDKWIKGTTRRGTADISLTIRGKSIMIEVKVGSDKPSEHQLKEQAKERAAGGWYEFVSSPEEFLEIYDRIVSL